jgi:hypothetical protein
MLESHLVESIRKDLMPSRGVSEQAITDIINRVKDLEVIARDCEAELHSLAKDQKTSPDRSFWLMELLDRVRRRRMRSILE